MSEELNKNKLESSSAEHLSGLKEIADQNTEAARDKLEKRAEVHVDSKAEQVNARHEVEKTVTERGSEKDKQTSEKQLTAAERRGTHSTKKEREASYKAVMADARSHMSKPSRAFSKVIHNPVVEKVSETAASTVARPNAILSGAVSAFFLVLVVYLVARFYGYSLSGSESIFAFIAGWLIGILYDFFRVMITGKRA